MAESLEILRSKLNGETAKMDWNELVRYFAKGVVVKVEQGMDLVDVAARIAADDKPTIEHWLNGGQISRASNEDAISWNERQTLFWVVVTVPWVIVQEAEKRLDA
jgi:hypothetical protein